ncbi:MAG TPA: glycosyltransferase family 2 protein [Candidatus Omnitrophota bacterium]|nr:glycosyltransferase family 2 protein [Candidatus Omnitrophota bacterium]HPT07812.1 glycosyltransferase family 2 protein [Candidatus Omnitrophota bacterium]
MDEPIEVSVVMPCLNEEEGVGICIKKITEVFAQQHIRGEIIVADNGSTDRSCQVAESLGARVFHEPKKGYGAAYLCGLRQARGTYIVIGDSDDSYDFYDIPRFLDELKRGCDFVMGSRFLGKMQRGAMSWTHRYIGNPILSGMTRLFFRTRLSDIHCGMRAFTRVAYEKMDLVATGMEFATEMVVAALRNSFSMSEVPINYRVRAGESKLMPLADAWRHIRFMLLYCPVWLYFIPGTIGFLAGMFVQILLVPGPFLFVGHYWDVHFMVFASLLSILSYQVLHLGVYAHTFAIRQGFLKYDAVTVFFKDRFNLERGLLLGLVMLVPGLIILGMVILEWIQGGFGALTRLRESIFGMTLVVIAIQTMFSSFFISLLFLEKK